MKIRRGPKTTGELDVTDEATLPSDAWRARKRFEFNITKEFLPERKSIIQVEITEEDIDSLHRGLEEGRRNDLLTLREQLKIYEKALQDIWRTASLQSLTQRDDFRQNILGMAQEALEKFDL